MGKGRPGGNPDFGSKYSLTTSRPEPLTETISIRLPSSMKEKLKQLQDYPEFIREAIADKFETMEREQNPRLK